MSSDDFDFDSHFGRIDYNDRYDDEDFFLNMSGKVKSLTCKMCHKSMHIYMPLTIEEKIACFLCCNDIISISLEFSDSRKFKLEHKNKIFNALEDIKEIGMNPTRIRQTQLYEYKWIL